MSCKKNQCFTFTDNEHEPAPVETPALPAAQLTVPFSRLTMPSSGVSARELCQLKADAIKRKHEANMAVIKSLLENDCRMEKSNHILAENNAYYCQICKESNCDKENLIADCDAGLGALM